MCERDTSAEKYQGQICKTCAPRKVGNFTEKLTIRTFVSSVETVLETLFKRHFFAEIVD